VNVSLRSKRSQVRILPGVPQFKALRTFRFFLRLPNSYPNGMIAHYLSFGSPAALLVPFRPNQTSISRFRARWHDFLGYKSHHPARGGLAARRLLVRDASRESRDFRRTTLSVVRMEGNRRPQCSVRITRT
jgi:hypothetical protein